MILLLACRFHVSGRYNSGVVHAAKGIIQPWCLLQLWIWRLEFIEAMESLQFLPTIANGICGFGSLRFGKYRVYAPTGGIQSNSYPDVIFISLRDMIYWGEMHAARV